MTTFALAATINWEQLAVRDKNNNHSFHIKKQNNQVSKQLYIISNIRAQPFIEFCPFFLYHKL